MLIALLGSVAMGADCTAGPVAVDGQVYGDLTSGLAAATAGATVEVCPGTWSGMFVASVPVDLVGVGGAAATTLDGGFAGTVLELAPGSSVTGLTVTGGAALFSGGGVALSAPGALSLVDCAIVDNHAEEIGGGIYLPGGSELQSTGSRIADNSAHVGGGIALDIGGGGLALDDTVIEDNLVIDQPLGSGGTSPGFGGGVYHSGGWITGGDVRANRGERQDGTVGGAAAGIAAGGPLDLEGTVIADNAANLSGGLALFGDSTLTDVLVEGNSSQFWGGGVEAAPGVTGTVTAYGSTIRGNETLGFGGGVVTFASGSTLRWLGGRIEDNLAGSSGGGFFMLNGFVEVIGVEFRDNVSRFYGGALGTNFGSTSFPASILIDSCDFVGNVAELGDGGGADLGVGGLITNSRFARNRTGVDGGALTMYGYGFFGGGAIQYYEVTNSTFEHNEAARNGGAMIVTYTADATVDGIVARDNRADAGGAVAMLDGTMTVTNSDLGDCPDNLPDDVAAVYIGVSERYGASASFGCDAFVGCSPPGTPPSCVDPSAPSCVDPGAHVGNQAVLGAGAEVRDDARVRDRAVIGDVSRIGEGATVGFDAAIGAQAQVCDDSRIRDRATLGDDVTIGVDSTIGFDVDVRADAIVGDRTALADRVTVEAGATVGDDVTVGFDVTIGAGAVVGDDVVIRDRATIGEGAVLGDGVLVQIDATVAPGAIVPAGAVVSP